MAERTLSWPRFGLGPTRSRLRLAGLGTVLGIVAGMGSFMYAKTHLVPGDADPLWILALVGVAGAYTHFLARDLSDSISISLVAAGVGIAFHTVAWIAPLWILSYPPFARDLVLPTMLGDAIQSAILVMFMTFYGAYFGAVLLGGYFGS